MEKPRVNKRRDKKDKSTHSIKIVVRHLPPTMTEKEFLEQVDPLPKNESYYYCPADWSLGQEATCRAYIDMSPKDIDEILQFRDRFDGYVFVDSKGAEYVAIVEYAPFQWFLKNKARSHDNKVNTIEKEPHFQEFLQKLAEEREEANRLGDVKIDFNFESKNEEKVKSTPLLQYLANKKEKRREELRKRNEEKRKHREEQKLLKAAEQPENAKTKESAPENPKKPGNNNNQKKGFNKEGQGSEETVKNARSKRRTERDQRRREEHEQRKLVRDRENRDKKKNDKDTNQKQTNRNSNTPKDNQKGNKEIVILKKKPNEADTAAEAPSETASKAEVSSEPAGSSTATKEVDKAQSVSVSTNQKNTKPVETYKERQNARADERRIRNKDRPSIAIYQPKVRVGVSSEDNSPSCKDVPAFPSDGDVAMSEETLRNKRFGRRNRQKPQDNKDNFEATRRESKSSESSTSAHSIVK
ncbi:PREDICTED: regulator of nonsense transcripts 3B [Drosophila arizonae]|uniref:Regulator of nonsense transcripts 3B n=1 Tax=Drosophila arizonae TaxID=7263 RepID=A0ABM1PJV9_DROAR|nr:PREDICTED: regulator of nonsense transcripts 3B [Drosophila arizonae]